MKKTNTKKTLGMSLISLLACGIMFAGSTYAWFTDEVVASGNKIESGTLKADMEVLKGNDWVSLKENPTTKIFDYDKWEPGYTASASLRILNKGNLGFRYQVLGAFAGETFGPNGESLGDVIDVYYKDGQQSPASFAEVSAEEAANGGNLTGDLWAKVGTLNEWMAMPLGLTSGYMLPEGASYDTSAPEWHNYDGVVENGFTGTFVLHMREDAGNAYQELSLGDVNLTLKATQWSWEKDGFGNSNYDDAATIKTEAQLVAALEKGGEIELGAPVSLSQAVEISEDTVINLNGYDLDASACASRPFSMANGADLTINATNSEIKAGNYGLVNITNGETKVVLNGGSYTSNMDNGSFVKPRGSAKVDIELNNVKFADASDDSYIVNSANYDGTELSLTINGGDYSCAYGIVAHDADISVNDASISTSLLAFEAGVGSTLLIEDSEISVLTNTENPAAPSACVALSDTTGTNPSSATIKNSVLNSKYHVFANYSGHNTLTYTDCEINHSGDAAQLMIYDNPSVGSSLVVNGMEAASVETPAALASALADTSVDYIALSSDVALTEQLNIAADREVVLDLAGCDVTVSVGVQATSALINNKGALTITGDGHFGYTSTTPSEGFWYSTSTIVNSGKLTIDGGTFINYTSGGASYVIDNAPGAELEINGGYFYNKGIVLRAYSMNGSAANNVVINGGEFVSEASRVLQAHLISSTNGAAPVVNIEINGGTFTTLDEVYGLAIYSYSAGTSMENVTFTLNAGVVNGHVGFDGGSARTYPLTNYTVSADCTVSGLVFSYAE